MVYNTTFDICAIIIYLFALYYIATKKHSRKLQNKIFFVIIATGIVCCIADVTNALVLNFIAQDPPAEPPFWLRGLLQATIYTYVGTHTIMPWLFCMYTMEVAGWHFAGNMQRVQMMTIPLIVSLLLVTMNPFMHMVFYYDELLGYHRGPLMYSLYITGGFYIAATLHFAIKYRAAIPNNRNASYLLFVLAGVAGTVIQFFVPTLLVEMFAESVVLLCILFTIETDDEIYNGITKVYNRRTFISDATTRFDVGDGANLIVLKLTNTRYYQSVLGIAFTNELLRRIAAELISVSRTTSVYDCENGNFAIFLDGQEPERLAQVAQELQERFAVPWGQDEINVQFTTVIYAMRVPQDISSLDTLVSLIDGESDRRHEVAKARIVTGQELSFIQREQKIERAIQHALDTRSLRVYFQPIWEKASNKIHSAEALVRLYDAELGEIAPEEFIPIAERNNNISEIGDFVFEEVVRLIGERNIHQYGIKFIEVNLSPVQFMRKNLVESFRAIMEKYEVNAPSINLEITESAAINNPESFLATMQQLRNMGFTFSLDDYGTGYSNAANIFNLDFDIIKLDKSILWKADQKASAKIILRNTIQMIKEMNLKIVMEGVETDVQKRVVTSLGCDYVQGYFFSRPMEADRFIDYCRRFNKI